MEQTTVDIVLERANQPLCKDCEFFTSSLSKKWNEHRCLAPQNEASRTQDLVVGEIHIERHFASCSSARTSEAIGCGAGGKWFVPKAVYTPKELKLDNLELDL